MPPFAVVSLTVVRYFQNRIRHDYFTMLFEDVVNTGLHVLEAHIPRIQAQIVVIVALPSIFNFKAGFAANHYLLSVRQLSRIFWAKLEISLLRGDYSHDQF